MPHVQTHVYLHSEVSPIGEAIEAGTYFVASSNWCAGRTSRRTVSEVSVKAYWEAALRGESASHAPEDVPERYRSDAPAEPDDGDRQESPPGERAPFEAEKAEAAREHLDAQAEQLREALPGERPGQEAEATERVVWALLVGDYNDRRSVVADVTDAPAMGGDSELTHHLLVALYDREMADS